jgi:surfactin synthase thioesterase subunit
MHTVDRSSGQGKAWIFGARPLPQARWRLFCLPNAGGGASAYCSWVSGLAPQIAVYPVQLPGRENRLMERPIQNMDEIVSTLAQVLTPYWDGEFALFGHSMGALICFALTRYLRQQGLPLPSHLFLSAYRAPHTPLEDLLSRVSDDELIRKILSLHGTQREVFANPELRRLLLPIFRADFALCETYAYTPEAPLAMPFTVFGGKQDNRVSQDALEAWHEHTDTTFTLKMLPGDHFFWQSNARAVWYTITQTLMDRSATSAQGVQGLAASPPTSTLSEL